MACKFSKRSGRETCTISRIALWKLKGEDKWKILEQTQNTRPQLDVGAAAVKRDGRD